MSEQFKVDEVAILRNDPSLTVELDMWRYEGEDCVVTEGLAEYETAYMGVIYGYKVTLADGKEIIVAPHELRKKRPPQSSDAWAADMVRKVTKPVEQPEGVKA